MFSIILLVSVAVIAWKVQDRSIAPHLPRLSIICSRGFTLIVKVSQGDLPGAVEDASLPLAVAVMPPHTPEP